MSALAKSAAIAAAMILVLCAGFMLDEVSVRTALYAFFGVSAISVFFLPYPRAIQILFLYIGFEGFAKIMTNYNPVVHVGADLLVVALTARWMITHVLRGDTRIPQLPPFTKLIAIHFTWFLIAICNPFALSWVASIAAAKLYVSMVILYFFGYYLATDTRRVRQFISPWIIVCLVHSTLSVYQGFAGPASVTRISPAYAAALKKFEGYAFRPFGLTNQPGAPSVFLFLTAPFMFYLFVDSASLELKIILGLLLSTTSVTLLLCQVRSAILKAIIGASGFVAFGLRFLTGKKTRDMRVRLVGLLAVVGLLVGIALPVFVARHSVGTAGGKSEIGRSIERSMTLFNFNIVSTARSGAWERFSHYASQAPFGAGLSRTGAAAGAFQTLIDNDPYFPQQFFADNFWIATVVDLGIPGTIILTVLIFGILLRGARQLGKAKDPHLGAAHAAILCSLVSIVIGFYGAEGVLYNPEAPFFWFFAGVMMRIPTLQPEHFQDGNATRVNEPQESAETSLSAIPSQEKWSAQNA